MRALVAAAALSLLAMACGGGDPCDGVAGACIALTVDGAGAVDAIDALDVRVVDGSGQHHDGRQGGPRTSLPTLTAVELPAGIDGALTLVVTGSLGGNAVGSGVAHVTLAPGTHASAEVTLGTIAADGGTPDATQRDAAALDATAILDGSVIIDGATPPDFAVPPDLFLPFDLTPPPPDLVFPLCPTGALFCDDFEGANFPNEWSATVISGSDAGTGDNVMLTTSAASSPTHSAQFTITTAGDGYDLVETLASASDTLYVRAWFYATAVPPDQSYLLRLTSSSLGIGTASVSMQIQGGQWHLDYAGGNTGSSIAFALHQWQCATLLYSSGLMQLNVGGLTFGASSTTLTQPLDQLWVGLSNPATAPASVFVDDIAISTTYLACP